MSRLIPSPSAKRSLAIATFVNTVGSGMFMASSALYFVRVVHLPATSVGIGLMVAGLVGLAGGIPVGDLADRRGPREVYITTLVVQFLTMASLVLVHSFVAFVLLKSLDALAASSAGSSRGALVRRVGGERPAVFRAKLKALSNAGVPIGALAAGFAVQIDSKAAYTTLILVNAASYLISAAFVAGIPHYDPISRPMHSRRWSALADRPFAAFTAVNGLMSMQYAVTLIPLPIWIASHTNAPRWIISATLALNTVMCVLLQVRFGSRTDSLPTSARAMRMAGLMFLISCPLMALIGEMPAWQAATITVLAVAVHTVGELWHSSGSFTIGFELAPRHAQGQYLGLQGVGTGIGGALAPALLTFLCLDGGRLGWFLLGCIFALVGLLAERVVYWAERSQSEKASEDVRLGMNQQKAEFGSG
ncbi:MFS transporter [Streptomyces sp. NBC_00441]|uniref:MFS transporter n=1 Tax=Streptomyces sp. NBC_00441 TaxID=2975742 RepID=UPI002E2BDE34|nr:MFS transporter [Streptomyces sp. NBC_00441]